MKNIKIKSLQVINFKGLKHQEINFNTEGQTWIFGANGTGKTSLYDAFIWLLFGKDSTDRKDFEIKNTVHTEMNRAEHVVSGTFQIDEQEILLKRIYKEKWVKKRGSTESEFAGNETIFFFNDVPCSQSEYNSKIALISQGENVFKLITNVQYFNQLKWQERREILLRMCGGISDVDILSTMKSIPETEDLIFALNSKTIAEYQREIAAKKKKIKDELVLIPARIDEVIKGMPGEIDEKSIHAEIFKNNEIIKNIDKKILDKNSALDSFYSLQKKDMTDKQTYEMKLLNIESHLQKKVFEENKKRASKSEEIAAGLETQKANWAKEDAKIKHLESKISDQKSLLEKLSNQWDAENSKTFMFNRDECICPTCKRELPSSDIDASMNEMQGNFNKAKVETLSQINKQGQESKELIKKFEDEMKEAKANLDLISESITNIQVELQQAIENKQADLTIDDLKKENEEYLQTQKLLEALNSKPKLDAPVVDVSELTAKKQEINSVLDSLKGELAKISAREYSIARRDELLKMESQLSNDLVKFEGIENAIMIFNKTKSEMIEQGVSSKFKIVKFKMFRQQINGGEEECCITMVNGVPYEDVNNAAKVQAGLDIIEAISTHSQIFAPVFIDNRESVVHIPDSNIQIINLYVSEQDKSLRVK